MGTPASLLDLIAHGGSLRAGLDNSQVAADTAHTQAATRYSDAQIPLLNQQTAQAAIDTQIKQQNWKDLQAEMTAWAKLNQGQATPQAQAIPQGQPAAPATPSGQPAPQMAPPTATPSGQPPQIATPAINPNAPAANASMVNPISSPQSYGRFLQGAGVSGPYAMQRMKSLVDYQKDVGTMDKEQLANEQERHTQIGAALNSWQQNPSPEGYQQLVDYAKTKEPSIAALFPAQTPDPNSPALAAISGITGAHEKMLADQKTKQDIATGAATASKDTADAAKTNVDTDVAKFKFNLMQQAAKQNPNSVADSVKGMSIFQGHPQEMQDAIDAGTRAYQAGVIADPATAAEKAQAAVKDVADRLRAFSPGVEQGKVAEAAAMVPVQAKAAGAEAAARAPYQISIEKSAAGYRNALEQGDKGKAGYFESLTSMNKSLATADTIQRVIDLSRDSNNKVASQQLQAMIPEFTNAAQDIKRMGGGQNNAGLSTLLDKAIGEIKSGTGHNPLTDNTRDQLEPFVHAIAHGAVQQHNATVKALKTSGYPGADKFQEESSPYDTKSKGSAVVKWGRDAQGNPVPLK